MLPILYGIIRGLMRGVVTEVFAIVGIVLGIVMARLYVGVAVEWLQGISSWDAQLLRPIASFTIFVVVALVCKLLSYLLTKLFKLIALSWLNRLVGALFGAAKWILIVAVLILCIDSLDGVLHFIKPEVKGGSVLYTMALQLVSALKDMVVGS